MAGGPFALAHTDGSTKNLDQDREIVKKSEKARIQEGQEVEAKNDEEIRCASVAATLLAACLFANIETDLGNEKRRGIGSLPWADLLQSPWP